MAEEKLHSVAKENRQWPSLDQTGKARSRSTKTHRRVREEGDGQNPDQTTSDDHGQS